MIANFYNTTGSMMGTDIHEFIVAPKLPVPLPYMANVHFSWKPCTWWKRVEQVTMDKYPSLQNGMDYYLIPHTPPPAFTSSPAEQFANLIVIVLDSGSKAWMSAHKVHLAGEKAAICIASSASTNVNCNFPVDHPFLNSVTNINSVQTNATAGDYLGSLAGALIDGFLGFAVGEIFTLSGVPDPVVSVIKHLWRRMPDVVAKATDNPIAKGIADAPGAIADLIQKSVDGEL